MQSMTNVFTRKLLKLYSLRAHKIADSSLFCIAELADMHTFNNIGSTSLEKYFSKLRFM